MWSATISTTRAPGVRSGQAILVSEGVWAKVKGNSLGYYLATGVCLIETDRGPVIMNGDIPMLVQTRDSRWVSMMAWSVLPLPIGLAWRIGGPNLAAVVTGGLLLAVAAHIALLFTPCVEP